MGLGPPLDGGNLCRAVVDPAELVSLRALAVRQIACGETSSYATAMDGRLLLWGTPPVSTSALHPVWEDHGVDHAIDGGRARQCRGENQKVLWPCFLKNQPPGYVSLPAMGCSTSALLMMVTLPPSAPPAAQEQENSSANLPLVQHQDRSCLGQQLNLACGVKRKVPDEDASWRGDSWERRWR